MSRLSHQPGEVIDRSRPVEFTWNGRAMAGFEGDTIASALVAGGVRIVSRSMKYHRPRGYLTNDYWDPNGLVQVGDDPNVRSAHRLLEPGMNVDPQNVWPSLDHDLKAVNGLVSRFLTAGFYYKTFMRPQWLWPVYEKILATFAPGGRIDLDTPHRYHDKRYTHPDVVVAGGGPAGMAAAIAAAEAGARVLLVEHCHRLGGHLQWGSDSDRTLAADLAADVTAVGVEVLTDSTVTGRYEDNWIAIVQRNHPIAVERLIKARAKVLIVAPGLIERPYVFAGNDKPGVMLSGAVRRFINMYAVKPGTTAVVFTANSDGDAAATDLARVGVEVEKVDARRGDTIVAARGGAKSVKGVELADGTKLECDLLVTATGWTAPTSLLNMSGDRPVYDESAARFFPSAHIDNVLGNRGHRRRRQPGPTHRARPGHRTAGYHPGAAGSPPSPGGNGTGRAGERRRAPPGARVAGRRPPLAAPPPPSGPVPLHDPRPRRLLRRRELQRPGGGRRGGLRLRRASQALHHCHYGPDPRQAGNGQHRGDTGRGSATDDIRGRHHRVATALCAYHPGSSGRPRVRTGAGVLDPTLARSQRRHPHPCRPMDPPRALRRPGRRSAQYPPGTSASWTSPRWASSTSGDPTCRSC